MRFASTLLAAALFAVQVSANLIAWDGNACDGDEGGTAGCTGACIPLTGRHSFEVGPDVVGSGGNTVILFEGDGCTGESFDFGFESPGECININTGTAINSGLCT
ncbi:hypothetical protein K438DRAFT_1590247 [Mycena galopus ATCC 62051]|nr:hypothetical protein K438DRAFT_1590247 [Mycena galopus ATCC 62051]